ncbi:acyloxyacyl hydrolase [Croceibacter atlanticus]|jgi:hypothetical protein|uniref:acyloxyacyl hydrolase n=1 Tax=Croceibacter atlanticus TaxID=313588 RepID=UPI0024BB44C2|nr:acyloxyacyl hydrolase [Croceibacter atlanticus]
MRKTILFVIALLIISNVLSAQNVDNLYYLSPEILVGKTLPANTDFPNTNLQTALFFSFGTYNLDNEQEWAVRLNYPKTGLSLAVIDFGNPDQVGQAITVMPFVEFSVFKKYSDNFNLNVGYGASYMNTQYDFETNPLNRAITTKVNWSFRSFLYYNVLKDKLTNWRLGLGYIHHSNGHTRLPNQGLNSLLASVSATINTSKVESVKPHKPKLEQKSETYTSSRFGLGYNTLSDSINTKKEVYTVAFEIGKVINKTFKFGGGFYARYYQHFYDYIKDEEALINSQYPNFKDNAFAYSTNYGVFGTAELLLGHLGVELDLGLNLYKPFYKLEWQITQGYRADSGNYVYADLDSYYELKRTISSRLGVKYYLITNNKSPKHNLFLSAHINANLGQADFSEISLGYTYRFKN